MNLIYNIDDLGNGVKRVTSLFLNHINDGIVVYIVEDEDGYYVTDDGYYANECNLMDVEFDISKELLNRYWCGVSDQEIICRVKGDSEDMAVAHLIQLLVVLYSKLGVK